MVVVRCDVCALGLHECVWCSSEWEVLMCCVRVLDGLCDEHVVVAVCVLWSCRILFEWCRAPCGAVKHECVRCSSEWEVLMCCVRVLADLCDEHVVVSVCVCCGLVVSCSSGAELHVVMSRDVRCG